MKRLNLIAAALLVTAAAACGTDDQPTAANVEARLNTTADTTGRGPGGVIGVGEETISTTSTDSTARAPGGVIGSGH